MGDKLRDLNYCNECESLVNISHRCEQWSQVTTIPATAIKLILSQHEPEPVEQLRNQFEKEYMKYDLSRLENGLYNLVDINLLWDTWVRCARKNNIISGNQ